VALLVLLIAAIVGLGLAGCGGSSSKGSSAAPISAGVRGANTAPKPAGIASVAEANLPAEARDVIRRIDSGGPFQYREDGVTFQNREGLLPSEPGGYYREYTVATPGAADRGARRLILGRQGELYYTPDHYRSFLWVLRGGAT
jgi:ribonuclease T1